MTEINACLNYMTMRLYWLPVQQHKKGLQFLATPAEYADEFTQSLFSSTLKGQPIVLSALKTFLNALYLGSCFSPV